MDCTCSFVLLCGGKRQEDDGSILYGKEQAMDTVINSHLSAQKLMVLQGILHDFRDVLRSEPGKTTIVEHTIETGSAQPIRLALFAYHNHAYRDAVHKELQGMEQAGVIEHSSSSWAAPIVPVKKKDGSIRLCVDYHRLNTVSCTYPMPRVDEMIDQLGGARYITTLDLLKGYWQVPVREEDRPKMVFTTPHGLYQF